MMRALSRLILVPLGLLLAAITTAGVLLTLGLERFTRVRVGRELDTALIGQLFDVIVGASSLTTVGVVGPALLVVIIGEVARIRAPLYYILGGGAAMAALPLAARAGSLGPNLADLGFIWQVFATAGFLGGAVYWLVAGRGA
jgi:hypothetical protein